MSTVLDLLSWVCLIGGALFSIIGGVGLLRLPDVYARSHASGISDTLGAGLILAGLMCQADTATVAVKLLMIAGFMFLIGPVSAHAVLKAAYSRGVRFEEGREGEDT